MPAFEYEVKTKTGKIRRGVLGSTDLQGAEAELLEQGYFIINLRPKAEGADGANTPISMFKRYIVNPLSEGAAPNELAVFYRQLAAMLHSGIGLIQSMRILSEQGESPRVRRIAAGSVPWLENGGKLSEFFAKYPWMFTNLQISILRAGELTGDLEGSADRLAHYLEWEYSLKLKIKVASLYPKILIGAVIFLPKLVLIFTDSIGAYLMQTAGVAAVLLIGVLVLWMLYRWLNQIPAMRSELDRLKLSIPKIGGLIKQLALAKFYRSLSAMYAAGVPLQQGIRAAAETVGNKYLTNRLLTAVSGLDKGYALVDCLAGTRVLPRLAMDLLRTGKATGNVDQMLDKLAEYTEQDVEVSAMTTTIVAGVLIFLLIALWIGMIVVKFYSGYAASVSG
jgi:type II secretory pathway component PulF